MVERVDARGLSCPQPIFMTQKAIWKVKTGMVEVLVDDGTSKQNVARTAEREGWKVEINEIEDGEFLLTLTKKSLTNKW